MNYKTKNILITILAGNKAHPKNCSNSVIPLVHNMAQNKAINDDNIASVLDGVDTSLSEAESSDSNN
jgi:hypothetical protein